MTRKSISLVLVILLALTVILGGCRNQKATEDFKLPEEDAAAQEAEANTAALTATAEAAASGGEGTVEATEPADNVELTTEPITEPSPTPIVIEVTDEPTAEPDTSATVEATAEPVATSETTESEGTSTTPGKHIVQAGENLYRIALRYGTSVDALAIANGITNPAMIVVGQELQIPSGSGTATLPSTGSGTTTGDGARAYIVQPGDNLFRIALKYNYDQFYIARYNGISNPALIYPGQTIRIPSD